MLKNEPKVPEDKNAYLPSKAFTATVDVTIVNGDVVWKLGKFQSVYNELRCYVESASPCTNLLKFWQLIIQQYG